MTPYLHRLRVYWEDTDAGGVVFYANHLKFFERARTEWLRALGFSQHAMLQSLQVMFVVTDAHIAYRAPARLDDELDISVQVKRLGGASITLAQRATLAVESPSMRADGGPPLLAEGRPQLLAEGSVTVGCVNAGTFRPCRLPNAILEKLA
jgi:acyl-CoA thioester hydrolase